jgi:hypothetical protein
VPIDPYLALLEDGAALYLATRDAGHLPDVALLAGAAPGPEPGTLTIYLPRGWTRALDNLRATGVYAMTMARLSDYRTYQLKGRALGIRDAREDERETVARQHEAFARAADEEQLGHVARAWVSWPCAAIDVRIDEVFAQTPAPGAGQKVSP